VFSSKGVKVTDEAGSGSSEAARKRFKAPEAEHGRSRVRPGFGFHLPLQRLEELETFVIGFVANPLERRRAAWI